MKTLHTLDAITALDGRYREQVEKLAPYVSEKALIQARFTVEIRYLLALSQAGVVRSFTAAEKKTLEDFIKNFSDKDAVRVKEIEETTRHDVKAVEYLLREKLEKTSLKNVHEKIHLFLTSEDVNNLSQRIILFKALTHIVIPHIEHLIVLISKKAQETAGLAMLARTHGQAAIPTTFGKELAVFAKRLDREADKLKNLQLSGKLSGAVGNYNAFAFGAGGDYETWKKFSAAFVAQFGFTLNTVTTQINTPEDIIELLQVLVRANTIGIDFASDMWRYISDNWLIQEKVAGEVGSSTMPQKVNPIDFENGEGNLSLANDVINGLAARLPVSRLQRDLRDSTQLRSIGLILGYTVLGFSNIEKGFLKIAVNREKVLEALHSDWSILSEGAQVWLRIENEALDPYKLFKEISRGKKLSQKEWEDAIKKLSISEKAKKKLLTMTPENYTGYARDIACITSDELLKKYVK